MTLVSLGKPLRRFDVISKAGGVVQVVEFHESPLVLTGMMAEAAEVTIGCSPAQSACPYATATRTRRLPGAPPLVRVRPLGLGRPGGLGLDP